MKYKLLLSIIGVLCITSSFAQEEYTKEKLMRVVPVSPNAASLGIFGSTPVGHHTGVPQISIPIHEIEFDGLKLPIEISYHASGIKVAQEASSVGLGWALNAGGCISRNIQHLDDFAEYRGNYVSLRAKPEDIDEDSWYNPKDYMNFMGFNGTYDSEPDFFSYSFGPYSGNFYLDHRNKSNGYASIVGGGNSTQIRYIESTGKFEAMDAQGFRYIFGSSEDTREYTTTFSQSRGFASNINNIDRGKFQPTDNNPLVTAWYLEEIISPRNGKIKFNYAKETFLSKYHFSEEKYIRLTYYLHLFSLDNRYDYSSASYSRSEQLVLTSIEYDGGSIELGYGLRNDLENASYSIVRKLTSVSVYEKITNGQWGTKKRVKHCVLKHSYTGSNYQDSRLILDEVCFMPVEDSGNSDPQKYQFSYNNPKSLPSKYSQSVDYWGYYNGGKYIQGEDVGTDISPFIYLDNTFQGKSTISGRDRRPNEYYTKIGIINSITYPTGGKTIFEFEQNDFTDKVQAGTPTGNEYLSHGCGLRVKRIIDLSNDQDTASVKHFVYQKEGKSTGRLNIVPRHYRQKHLLDTEYGTLLPVLFRGALYINIHSDGYSSSILNSGDIGYSYVEEHIVASGKSKGYTAYSFINLTGSSETSVFGVPTIMSSSNGKPIEVTHFNSKGLPVKSQTIKYKSIDRGAIKGFKCYTPPMYDPFFFSSNLLGTEFTVQYYAISSSCQLESEVIEEEYFPNGTITQKTVYDYDENFNLKNYQKTTINGNVYETHIKYPMDFTDNISVNMKNRHMVGVPIETVQTLNGRVTNAQKVAYTAFEAHEAPAYLPVSIYGLSGFYSPDNYERYYQKEVQIDAYDPYGNVWQYTDRDNLKVVYLWGCGVYPLAVIKNASIAEVDNALTYQHVDPDDLFWKNPNENYLYGIQDELPHAHVTLFTHKPQVGVSSISNPSGKITYYDYDGLARLVQVRDGNNRKVESYDYNYSNK